MGLDMDGQGGKADARRLEQRIRLGRFRARLSLLAEQALPLTLAPFCILSLFLSSAWLGFFRALPDWLRWSLLFVLTFAFFASLLPFRSLRWASRAEADRRLEVVNGLKHQAISAQDDQPVTDTPFARALWERHRARMAREISALEPGLPKPDISHFDATGLRAIPALVLALAFAFSFSGNSGRLSDAFRNQAAPSALAGLRVDVWVTPPGYTSRPAVTLAANTRTPPVPQFSVLSVRLSGGAPEGAVTFKPLESEAPEVLKSAPAEKAETGKTAAKPAEGQSAAVAQTFTMKLERDGVLEIGQRSYPLTLIPDEAPRIAFDGKPRRTVNGALEIRFKTSDDYGLKSARADIVPLDQPPQAQPLFPLPDFPLDLPRGEGKELKGLASRNLTEHPLSGKRVRISLLAEDGAGHTGRSEPIDMILPARDFNEPLAAAVAEQRQIFSLDMRDIQRAIEYNDAVTLRGDESIPNPTHYLLIKSARSRMALARDEASLKDAAAYLWDIALGIDGGDVPMAEKAVRDAQKALADALKNNASDKEIQALMSELRKAMKQYMEAMAKRMQQMKPGQQTGEARNVIRQQDLERMMNQLENMARSGNKDAARQLLSEMQRMMNNMQAGPSQRMPSEAENKAREQVDKLGNILRDQQKLMEETYKLNQDIQQQQWQTNPEMTDPGQTDPGMTEDGMTEDGMAPMDPMDPTRGYQGQPGEMTKKQKEQMQALQKRQQALQKQLQELGKSLKALGMKPNKGLGQAQGEMDGAGKSLGRGEGQPAVEGQGRALEALRQGARQMMQAMGGGQGQGGQQPGQPGPGQQSGRDPLGRSRADGSFGNLSDGKVPDEIDVQRARDILESIRRKLGETGIAPTGRQYLERLLNLN